MRRLSWFWPGLDIWKLKMVYLHSWDRVMLCSQKTSVSAPMSLNTSYLSVLISWCQASSRTWQSKWDQDRRGDVFYDLAFEAAHCLFAIFYWSQRPTLTQYVEVGPPKDMNTSRGGSFILETGYYTYPSNTGYLNIPTYFLAIKLYLHRCHFHFLTLTAL